MTFAGSIVGPFLLDGRKRRAEEDAARRDELSKLIPRLFRLYEYPLVEEAIPEETSTLARFSLLVGKNDWPIVSMLTLIATPPYRAPRYLGAALDMVSAWFRGSITAAEVSRRFQQRVGIKIHGTPFDVADEQPQASAEPGAGATK